LGACFPETGFCEIDIVSHDGGGDLKYHYAWTLTVTGVCLCRAEVRTLLNKASQWTLPYIFYAYGGKLGA
jgi:hypothetical protein